MLKNELLKAISDNGLQFHLSPERGAGSPVSSIPIPAAVWLFGSGLIGLVWNEKKAAKNTCTFSLGPRKNCL